MQSIASSMSAGQWVQINVNGLSRELFVDGANWTIDYMDKGCYDPVHKQVRFIGQAHYGDQRYHQYDEATNTFSNLPDPPWDDGGAGKPSYLGHGYQNNAMDPATGDHYYLQRGNSQIRWLNRATGVWGLTSTAPIVAWEAGLEWLPSIGTQGGLVLTYYGDIVRWDRATNTWASVFTGGVKTYHNVAVRSTPNNVVICGGGNATRAMWKVGGSGSAVSIPNCPIDVGINTSVTTACPVSGDVLVINGTNNAVKFSVSSNNWSSFTISGPPMPSAVTAGSNVIAVPMPSYGVIMFIFGATGMWLYKHA